MYYKTFSLQTSQSVMRVEPRAHCPLLAARSTWLEFCKGCGCGQSQSQPGGEYEYEAAAVLQGVLQSVLPGILQKYT